MELFVSSQPLWLFFREIPFILFYFLVLTFVNVSSLLFFLELEYLPLVFIVVYVGALAVLFIFVMMMLNIRISDLKENNEQLLPVIFILTAIFFFHIFFATKSDFASLKSFFSTFNNEYSLITADLMLTTNWFSFDSNMRNLGFLLYSEFFYLFILAGFVLLLAMLGTIILTLRRFFKGRIQHPSFQIMRNFETAIKSTK